MNNFPFEFILLPTVVKYVQENIAIVKDDFAASQCGMAGPVFYVDRQAAHSI